MDETKYLSKDDVLKMLADACLKVGGLTNFAQRHRMSPSYISKLLTRKQAIGPKILKALRLKSETRYILDTKPAQRAASASRRAKVPPSIPSPESASPERATRDSAPPESAPRESASVQPPRATTNDHSPVSNRQGTAARRPAKKKPTQKVTP
jgi:hypothetical protein